MLIIILLCIILLGCSASIFFFSERNKLQKTLMYITLMWFFIFTWILFKHFILEVNISRSGILNFHTLLYGFMGLVTIFIYPAMAIHSELLTSKNGLILISPFITILIIYATWHIITGKDMWYYYTSINEFIDNIYSPTIILRLLMLICIFFYVTIIVINIMQLIPLYDKYISDNYTDTAHNVGWLKSWILALLFICILYLIMCFARYRIVLILYILSVMISFIFLTYNAIRSKLFVTGDHLKISFNITKGWHLEELISIPIDTDKLHKTIQNFDNWICKKKPFLKSTFSIDEVYQIYPLLRYPILTKVLARRGYTFQSYVRKCRIEYACTLMSDFPDMTFKEIAYKSGFTHADSFSRAFTQEIGKSPKAFKNN